MSSLFTINLPSALSRSLDRVQSRITLDPGSISVRASGFPSGKVCYMLLESKEWRSCEEGNGALDVQALCPRSTQEAVVRVTGNEARGRKAIVQMRGGSETVHSPTC